MTKFLDSLPREKGRSKDRTKPEPNNETTPVVGAHVILKEGTNDSNDVITDTNAAGPTNITASDTSISFGTNDVAAVIIAAAIVADDNDDEWITVQGDEDCFNDFDEDEEDIIVGMHTVVDNDNEKFDNSVDSTNYTMPLEG